MDTNFIGKPHHWDPRRVYSQTGADWQLSERPHRPHFVRRDMEHIEEAMRW